MVHSFNIVNKSKNFRKQGYSYEEIGKLLKISKSTAFYWTKDVILSSEATTRLKKREQIGQKKALQVLAGKRKKLIKAITNKALLGIKPLKINKYVAKAFCSLLYWAEGAKSQKNRINFINSDQIMIQTFLKLFRFSFPTNNKKFRVLVHIHEYHNDILIKKYWSKITKIPLKQFNRSYKKPHTHKRIREGYKGTINIYYHDSKVALEMAFIYNMLAQKILGAW